MCSMHKHLNVFEIVVGYIIMTLQTLEIQLVSFKEIQIQLQISRLLVLIIGISTKIAIQLKNIDNTFKIDIGFHYFVL